MEQPHSLKDNSNQREDASASSSSEEDHIDTVEAKRKQLLMELDGGLLINNKQLICEVIDDTALFSPIDVPRNSKNIDKTHPLCKIRVPSEPIGNENREEEDNHNERGNENGGRRKYSREEMESMSFVKIEYQKERWREIFTNLEPSIARGITSNHQKRSNRNAQESLHGNDEEDEDYSSIRRPAFAVEGEPDFASGPPEDGMEYLRRVRWEAASIPNVAVAKINESKISIAQTPYMPQIAEIPDCSDLLRPLKEWEEEFLSDFENVRGMLSREEDIEIEEGDLANRERGTVCGEVKLSTIMAMDSVARVWQLRKRIEEVERRGRMDREDGAWLFALCAAVDTPLHADTCASLRSLYRKCATLRAKKTEVDDELVMLNLLATISGRYFGQSER